MQLTLHLGQAQVLALAFLFEQRETSGMQRHRDLRLASVTASVKKGCGRHAECSDSGSVLGCAKLSEFSQHTSSLVPAQCKLSLWTRLWRSRYE